MKKTIIFVVLVFISCVKLPTTVGPKSVEVHLPQVRVAKWMNNKDAAISITYDIPYGLDDSFNIPIDDIRMVSGKISYEMITSIYSPDSMSNLIRQAQSDYAKGDVSFFCHGHTHINHDTLSPDAAYISFKTCRDLMTNWGLNTMIYAYPFGTGIRKETQFAAKKAGYLGARGIATVDQNYLICPDSEAIPENWYYLPGVLVIKDSAFALSSHAVVEAALKKVLDRTSWIIFVYHSIGLPNGYGYYPLEDFNKDINLFTSGAYWVDHMENITRYIQERAAAKVLIQQVSIEENVVTYEVCTDIDLDKKIYNHALTLEITPDVLYSNASCDVKVLTDGNVTDSIIPVARKGSRFYFNIVPHGEKYHIALHF